MIVSSGGFVRYWWNIGEILVNFHGQTNDDDSWGWLVRYWPPTTFLSRQQRISSGLSFQLFAHFLFSRSLFQHRVWILTQHYHFIFRAKFYLCNSFKCFPRFGRFLGQKILFCAFVDEIPFPALFLSLMRPFPSNRYILLELISRYWNIKYKCSSFHIAKPLTRRWFLPFLTTTDFPSMIR